MRHFLPGGRRPGTLRVLGPMDLGTSLPISLQEYSCLPPCAHFFHPQIPVTMPISWGLCVGYRSSPVLGSSFLNGFLAMLRTSASQRLHPGMISEPKPRAPTWLASGHAPCPRHPEAPALRPRRVNTGEWPGLCCVIVGAPVPLTSGQSAISKGPLAGDGSAEPSAVLS